MIILNVLEETRMPAFEAWLREDGSVAIRGGGSILRIAPDNKNLQKLVRLALKMISNAW